MYINTSTHIWIVHYFKSLPLHKTKNELKMIYLSTF